MKVVINKCFGGFGVSRAAAEFMAARGNKLAAEEVAEHDATLAAFAHYKRHGEPLAGRTESEPRFFDINIKYGSEPEFYGHMSDLERTDPDLVAAVEALGKAADGRHARLVVVEIPDGTEYEISEYDGNEHIAEKHRTWA
jgi:hypothetical protein